MKYSLERLLEKKNRTIKEWLLLENINNHKDLQNWELNNYDFFIPDNLKLEIEKIFSATTETKEEISSGKKTNKTLKNKNTTETKETEEGNLNEEVKNDS